MGIDKSDPPFGHDILVIITVTLTIGLSLGWVLGDLWARRADASKGSKEIADALSKPLKLQVSVTNSTAPPQGSKLLNLLADLAGRAIDRAETVAEEPAKISSVAATEFVKSLSGGVGEEAGKQLVDRFSELITSIKPTSDNTKDRQEIFAFFVEGSSPPSDHSIRVGQQPSPRLETRIVFGINQARLTRSSNAIINRVRDFARDNPGTVILLTANADTLGSERHNLDLAGRRSRAVRRRLVSAGGIASNRVFVSDLGNNSLPLVTPTDTAEEKNRSVTIEVRD